MLFRDKKSRNLPPVVRQNMPAAFPNRQMGMFGQRRHFSDPSNEKSYSVDQFTANPNEVRIPTIEPIDVAGGSRESILSIVHPGLETTTTVVEGGGGGGGGVTGSGSTGRISKWSSATALANSDIYEVTSGSPNPRIGIGQASPASGFKLDVAGAIKCDDLRVDDGTAVVGHVRTCTNTDGSSDWQAPGGGSGVTKGFVIGMASAL